MLPPSICFLSIVQDDIEVGVEGITSSVRSFPELFGSSLSAMYDRPIGLYFLTSENHMSF